MHYNPTAVWVSQGLWDFSSFLRFTSVCWEIRFAPKHSCVLIPSPVQTDTTIPAFALKIVQGSKHYDAVPF